jgi:hypothetical protein
MEVSQETRATVSDGNLPAQGRLDVDSLPQNARLLGREEERRRILKLFHDEAGSSLLSAMFEAQLFKEDLESRGLKEGQALSRIVDKLIKVADAMVYILHRDESNFGGAGSAGNKPLSRKSLMQ